MVRALPLLVLPLLVACGEEPVPEPTPTFTQVDDDILSKSCAFSSCHGGGSGGLRLDGTDADYDALVDVPSTGKPSATLVVPGDADASYLIQKLEGADGIVGVPMPQGTDSLEADRLQELRDWIDAGALR
jgi:hypothetical protein